MLTISINSGWRRSTGVMPMDHARVARVTLKLHHFLGFAVVSCFLTLGSAAAQSNNLVRNPTGDDGLQFWRVFGNAGTTDCTDGGKCFAINQDAFIYQDIDVTDSVTGMYAVFVSLSEIEQATPKAHGAPYIHGYFLTAGELRSATLLANLAGQEMETRPSANNEWVKQSGVFRVAAQTGRIRIFLRSGCGKTEPSTNCVSHFRKAGVFLFGSEEDAKAFAATYQ